MSSPSVTAGLLAYSMALVCAACGSAPGDPKPGPEVPRPDQIVDFATLYAQNCAGCHGAQGKLGAAIALADPVYLAIAGAANIQRVIAAGVSGTMMPPFGVAAGGMLTTQQIGILTQGMIAAWGNSAVLQGQVLPAYSSATAGDATQGEQTFRKFCSSCHPKDSLTDPAFLSLTSDQGLRSNIIAGLPQHSGARAMSDREITDTVAWLASKRIEGRP